MNCEVLIMPLTSTHTVEHHNPKYYSTVKWDACFSGNCLEVTDTIKTNNNFEYPENNFQFSQILTFGGTAFGEVLILNKSIPLGTIMNRSIKVKFPNV